MLALNLGIRFCCNHLLQFLIIFLKVTDGGWDGDSFESFTVPITLPCYQITLLVHTSSLTELCIIIFLFLAAPKFFLPEYNISVFFKIQRSPLSNKMKTKNYLFLQLKGLQSENCCTSLRKAFEGSVLQLRGKRHLTGC